MEFLALAYLFQITIVLVWYWIDKENEEDTRKFYNDWYLVLCLLPTGLPIVLLLEALDLFVDQYRK